MTSTIEPKLYSPFPPGEEIEGWPTTFVAVMDYVKLERQLKGLRASLEQLKAPEFDDQLSRFDRIEKVLRRATYETTGE